MTVLIESADARSRREQFIKAAYLFRLSLFVEWPTPLGGNLNFCVVDQAANTQVLQEALLNRRIASRPISVNAVTIDDDLSACQLLYIPDTVADVEVLLDSVHSYPVLTIGESKKFYRSRGMIYLFSQHNKIHFAFNLEPLREAGLRVSSQLLTLGEQPEE